MSTVPVKIASALCLCLSAFAWHAYSARAVQRPEQRYICPLTAGSGQSATFYFDPCDPEPYITITPEQATLTPPPLPTEEPTQTPTMAPSITPTPTSTPFGATAPAPTETASPTHSPTPPPSLSRWRSYAPMVANTKLFEREPNNGFSSADFVQNNVPVRGTADDPYDVYRIVTTRNTSITVTLSRVPEFQKPGIQLHLYRYDSPTDKPRIDPPRTTPFAFAVANAAPATYYVVIFRDVTRNPGQSAPYELRVGY